MRGRRSPCGKAEVEGGGGKARAPNDSKKIRATKRVAIRKREGSSSLFLCEKREKRVKQWDSTGEREVGEIANIFLPVRRSKLTKERKRKCHLLHSGKMARGQKCRRRE